MRMTAAGGAFAICLGLAAFAALAADGPQLHVAGAQDPDGVQISHVSDTFDQSFRIDLLGAASLDGGITVLVDPFVGPTNEYVQSTFSVEGASDARTPVPIDAEHPVTVRVQSTLPAVGAYKSTLFVIYNQGQERKPTPLTVTRIRPKPSVELVQQGSVEAWELFSTNVDVRLTLRETSGNATTLALPSLTGLVRKGEGTQTTQADYKGAELLDESGKPIEGNLVLAGGTTRSLVLRVKALSGPGEYTGTVLLQTPGGEPENKSITLLVKNPAWLGFAVIALGVGLSTRLRRYLKTDRSRALAQSQLLELRQQVAERLSSRPSEDERELLTLLDRSLEALWTSLENAQDSKEVDASVPVVRARLGLFNSWARVSRLVASLPPDVLTPEQRETLRSARAKIRAEEATVEVLLPLRREVEAIGDVLPDQSRKVLHTRVAGVITEVDTLAKTFSGDLGRKLSFEVSTQLQRVLGLIDKDEQAASDLLAQTRRTFVTLMIDNVLPPSTAPVPMGFDSAEWQDLLAQLGRELSTARVQAATDVDAAFAGYQRVHALYLQEVSAKLLAQIPNLLGQISPALEPSVQEALRTELKAIQENLEKVSGLIVERKLAEATALYENARKATEAVLPRLQAGSMMAAGEKETTEPPASVSPFLTLPSTGTAQASYPLPWRYTSASLREYVTHMDRVVDAVLVGVAVLVGYNALGIDSPTWGGIVNVFQALLWGFGLHQAGNILFEGFQPYRDKLAK